MPSYNPPLRDMQFLMHEVFKVTDDYQQMTAHAEVDADTINAVLEEAGKFAANVTFPLNISGDAERSEEHTSELQSQSNLVCRLLLEKKKTNKPSWITT